MQNVKNTLEKTEVISLKPKISLVRAGVLDDGLTKKSGESQLSGL